jgi:MFS family permease
MKDQSRSDAESYPLLPEQCFSEPDGQGTEKSRTLYYWARFRQPSPSWVVCVFTIYEFIFGVLVVPEFNSTFALICHQRYSPSQTHGDRPRDLSAELEQCFANTHAQSDLSRFLIYGQVTAGLLGAFSAPILGSLSDRVGRKPILACTVIGPLLHEILVVIILRHPDSIDMHWLLVGYAMEGLSGTMIAASSTSQTYITDLTPCSARARWFSYLQASFSFAGAVGPLIASLLLTMPDPFQLIYWLAIGSHLSLLVFVLFALPESRNPDSSRRPDPEGVTLEQPPGESYVRVFLASLKPIWESKGFRNKNMIILAGMDMIMFGNMIGLAPLQLAYPAFLFNWQPTTQSFFMSISYSWSVLVLVILFPPIMAWFRRRNRREGVPNLLTASNSGELGAIQVNLVLQMIGYMGIALSRAPSHFVVSSFVVASTISINPLLTSCLTAHVPDYQSGQLLGVLSFLHAIARIVIPALLSATYSMTVGIFPAPLFMFLSIVIGGLFLASIYIEDNTP